jgi:hypothetical protein
VRRREAKRGARRVPGEGNFEGEKTVGFSATAMMLPNLPRCTV